MKTRLRESVDHARDAAVFVVHLFAEVVDVQLDAIHDAGDRLEMFALVGVGFDDGVFEGGLALAAQIVVDQGRKFGPRQVIECEINVMTVLPQQLVADPPTRNAHLRIQLVVHTDCLNALEELFFGRRELDIMQDARGRRGRSRRSRVDRSGHGQAETLSGGQREPGLCAPATNLLDGLND